MENEQIIRQVAAEVGVPARPAVVRLTNYIIKT